MPRYPSFKVSPECAPFSAISVANESSSKPDLRNCEIGLRLNLSPKYAFQPPGNSVKKARQPNQDLQKRTTKLKDTLQ
jgi:hypothetical protein